MQEVTAVTQLLVIDSAWTKQAPHANKPCWLWPCRHVDAMAPW